MPTVAIHTNLSVNGFVTDKRSSFFFGQKCSDATLPSTHSHFSKEQGDCDKDR